MTPAEILSPDLADMAQSLRERHEPFAFATIVRTAGTTAAKPGAKAIIDGEGNIVRGFIGGGCARGAVTMAEVMLMIRPKRRETMPGSTARTRRIGAI